MFKKDFVVVIKNNGKILREDGDRVLLPFGSEYSIMLKNLSSRKAVVAISIDGTDVLGGEQLVVNANSTLDLERFLDKDFNVGNKFKFIEKTEKISEHRGDKIDDGIVRVEYWFEKEKPKQTITTTHHYDFYHHNYSPSYSILRGGIGGQSEKTFTSSQINNVGECYNSNSVNLTNNVVCDSLDTNQLFGMSGAMGKDGITTKGSVSTQKFVSVTVDELEEQSTVITLMLRGTNQSNDVIEQPLFVADKLECEMCGTKSKSSVKFCPECGTALR